ncbi:MAG: ABC transporter permease [Clostridium sp.]
MIWELIYRGGVQWLELWEEYMFPSPISVFSSLIYLIEDGSLLVGVISSVQRLLAGYLLSILVGGLIGVLIIRFKYLEDNLKPILLGLQSLPSICYIPFAILWFGLTESTILFVIIIGSSFSIATSVVASIRNVSPLYIKAAKTMGAKGITLYKEVILPASLPTIISGLKLGWSFAWRALMAGEMLVATKGLGQILMMGRDLSDISQVMAIMIVIIILGLIFENLLFTKIENRVREKWGLNLS